MTPLDVVLPDQDTDALAAAFLFATPPSDRALWGWDGAPQAYSELVELGVIDPMAGAA